MSFILKEIPDSCPLILDMGIRMLTVLLSHWRDILSAPPPQDKPPASSPAPSDLLALRQVEALGLVLICANRQLTRKKTFELLKEALQVSLLIPGSAGELLYYSADCCYSCPPRGGERVLAHRQGRTGAYAGLPLPASPGGAPRHKRGPN